MAKKKETIREYFIVNPSGTVHQVNRDHANQRLRQVGWRVATKAEIATYKKARTQTTRRRIAAPWKPEVDAGPDVDELMDAAGDGGEESQAAE